MPADQGTIRTRGKPRFSFPGSVFAFSFSAADRHDNVKICRSALVSEVIRQGRTA